MSRRQHGLKGNGCTFYILDEVYKMSFSDDYEIDPQEEDVSPEPRGYMYPVIDSFEEGMLQKRLLELIKPPAEGEVIDRDFLELTPDHAQPFIGAVMGIAQTKTDTKGMTGQQIVNAHALDRATILDALGTHLLIAFYVAKLHKIDMNGVIEESMTRIENLHAEDVKMTEALGNLNMTPGGSVIERSATDDEWPDPQF